MKIETSIKPRRDGTVTVSGFGSERIVFAANEDGALVAEIENEATIAALIDTGDFYPADEASFHRAAQIVQTGTEGADGAGTGGDDDDELDDDTDSQTGTEDAGNGGAPLEANTPPKPAAAGKRANKAR